VTVTEVLQLARSQGVEVTLDGEDLVLKAEVAPPPRLLAILGRGKWDIVAALRLREAEERRSIVQWVRQSSRRPKSPQIHETGGRIQLPARGRGIGTSYSFAWQRIASTSRWKREEFPSYCSGALFPAALPCSGHKRDTEP
jgi:hypothetical protein